MSLKVFIFGESGRMGQEIRGILQTSPHLEYCGGYSRKGVQLVNGGSPNVVIDFSLPETLPDLKKFVIENNCALVSGTTGYSDDQYSELKELSQNIPVFWAANMSFGIYLTCKMTEMLARYDKFYKFKIEETHHIHKKDKPSGTALIIEKAAKASTKQPVPIEAFREGEVFGLHKFIAESDNEKLEIVHEARNRGLFAQGAVDVSQWLVRQNPGFYGMDEFFQSI